MIIHYHIFMGGGDENLPLGLLKVLRAKGKELDQAVWNGRVDPADVDNVTALADLDSETLRAPVCRLELDEPHVSGRR